MEKVLYKVTSAFGCSPIGEIRHAYLLIRGDGAALLYHPKSDRYSCASIEFCKLDPDDDGDHYISCDEDSYANIESQKDLNRLCRILSKISYTKTK